MADLLEHMDFSALFQKDFAQKSNFFNWITWFFLGFEKSIFSKLSKYYFCSTCNLTSGNSFQQNYAINFLGALSGKHFVSCCVVKGFKNIQHLPAWDVN